MQRGDPCAWRMTMRLLLEAPVQPGGNVEQKLAQPRAAEVRGEFAIDHQRAPIVRLPMTIGGRQLTLLLSLDREVCAIALRAELMPAMYG